MANSNLVTSVPSHIAQRIAERQKSGETSAVTDALLQGGRFPYPRISIRAGRFRLVDEGVETPVGISMDTVIVGANPNVSKIFYAKAYDPNATDMRPDCFSNDGVRPDPSVQDPVSKSCKTCPNNELGSKITPSGAKSKLCNDQRHLCVVSALDPKTLYALTIPVSSMKSLREYIQNLKSHMLEPEEVVTELSFDETTSYPRVQFSQKVDPHGNPMFLSPEGLLAVEAVIKQKATSIKEITRQIPLGSALPAPTSQAALSGSVSEADVGVAEEGEVAAAPSEIEAHIDKVMGRA